MTDVERAEENLQQESGGWRALMIDEGQLDFSLVGILVILQLIAQQKISIFALSTFDTDYVLIAGKQLRRL